VKVRVPVGLAPPLKVAVSLIVDPSEIPGEALVVTLGDAAHDATLKRPMQSATKLDRTIGLPYATREAR